MNIKGDWPIWVTRKNKGDGKVTQSDHDERGKLPRRAIWTQIGGKGFLALDTTLA